MRPRTRRALHAVLDPLTFTVALVGGLAFLFGTVVLCGLADIAESVLGLLERARAHVRG